MRKVASNLRNVVEHEVAKGLPQTSRHIQMTPTKKTLQEDLNEAASDYRQEMEEETKKLLSDPSLKRFAVGGKDEDWDSVSKSGATPSAVSIKSNNGKRKPAYEERKQGGGGRGGYNNKKPFRGGKQ